MQQERQSREEKRCSTEASTLGLALQDALLPCSRSFDWRVRKSVHLGVIDDEDGRASEEVPHHAPARSVKTSEPKVSG